MAIISIPKKSFRWLLAETAVVVLGILIAFQVEEWRTNRTDRNLETSLLTSILVELERRDGTFRQYLEASSAQADAIVSFEDYLASGDIRKESELIELFGRAWAGFIWEAQSPAYLGWRDSGRVDIISSEELRTAIYDYHNVHLTYIENLTALNRIHRQAFITSAIKDIYQIVPRGRDVSGLQDNFRVVPPFEEIPRQPDFYGVMNRFGASSSFIARRLEISLIRTSALMEQIEVHLETL